MTLPAWPPVLQVCITIADGASYLAGCAKDFKTSAEASRITAEWMPRETASMRSRSTSRLAQRRGCSGHNTGAENGERKKGCSPPPRVWVSPLANHQSLNKNKKNRAAPHRR